MQFRFGQFTNDRTAVFADARGADESADHDHVRVVILHGHPVVVFRLLHVTRAVAEAIAKEAFHNVAYFGGTFDTLKAAVR